MIFKNSCKHRVNLPQEHSQIWFMLSFLGFLNPVTQSWTALLAWELCRAETGGKEALCDSSPNESLVTRANFNFGFIQLCYLEKWKHPAFPFSSLCYPPSQGSLPPLHPSPFTQRPSEFRNFSGSPGRRPVNLPL